MPGPPWRSSRATSSPTERPSRPGSAATSSSTTCGRPRVAQTETSLPLITIVIGFAGDEGTNLGPDDIVTGPDGSTWKASEQRYRDDYDWNRLLYSGENSITNYYATMSNDKFSWTPATEETAITATGKGRNS